MGLFDDFENAIEADDIKTLRTIVTVENFEEIRKGDVGNTKYDLKNEEIKALLRETKGFDVFLK